MSDALAGLEPMTAVTSVSAVFPCYNDATTIGGLVDDVHAALSPLVADVEVIVVNDGSADDSRGPCSKAWSPTRPWLRVIHHETNGGYGKALLSGFGAAQHEWIFYTDGDAQYDAQRGGAAGAAGHRRDRRGAGLQDRPWRLRGTAR